MQRNKAALASRSMLSVEAKASNNAWKVRWGYHLHSVPLKDRKAFGLCWAAMENSGKATRAKSSKPRCTQFGAQGLAACPSSSSVPMLTTLDSPSLLETKTKQVRITTF